MDTGNHAFTNRLIHESSPYLQEHAHNPVDWYPWGPEALQRAKRERRPILLSIGYSACHWCHVMARESFECLEIARLMNDHFVNIKVDREERPDIDHIYQAAAQIISGQGGWPLTIFLTPDQKPFYAGTYFPPQDRYGRPGFKRVLSELARLWENNPEQIEEAADEIAEALKEGIRYNHKEIAGPVMAAGLPSTAPIRQLKRAYDPDNGGFGGAPKFPHVNILNLFLQQSKTQSGLLHIVTETLSKMARGGIYDQLGGGFHRYSTDARWLVPHFEKMLYDNALLASLYLDVYQKTKDQKSRNTAMETLDYVLRDMTAPEGGFYSSEDADSEGKEGKFYVWRRDEILQLLGEELGELLCRYYGVSQEGNFEDGTSVLHRDITVEELAGERGLDAERARSMLEDARRRLGAIRGKRVRPRRDEKIITAWNGMMISALAKAGRILGEERYTGAGRKAAEFAMANLSLDNGQLRRAYKDGPGNVPGFLEDYAYLAAGLIDLYQATFDYRWLRESLRLTDLMIDLFWSDEEATFFDSPFIPRGDGSQLFLRPQNPVDESFPSGMSIAARNLLLLSAIRDESGTGEFMRKVELLLGRHKHGMEQDPWGFASFLSVANLYRNGVTQIVFVVEDKAQKSREGPGRMAALKSHELFKVISDTYIPGLLLLGPPMKELDDPELAAARRGKASVNGKPTVYICHGFSCSAPITDARELRHYLDGASPH